MAAIANYGELRQAVSEYVDHRNISTVLSRLVQTAESKLNRELRTRYQITSLPLTFTSGIASLPADFLEISHALTAGGYPYRSGTLADFQTSPGRYSVDGTNVYLKGFSGSQAVGYYASLPTLTTSAATTNWLLLRYPDVYLYAVGFEAAKHLKDVDLAQASKALLDDAMQSLRADDERARWSNTTVRVQGPTP